MLTIKLPNLVTTYIHLKMNFNKSKQVNPKSPPSIDSYRDQKSGLPCHFRWHLSISSSQHHQMLIFQNKLVDSLECLITAANNLYALNWFDLFVKFKSKVLSHKDKDSMILTFFKAKIVNSCVILIRFFWLASLNKARNPFIWVCYLREESFCEMFYFEYVRVYW